MRLSGLISGMDTESIIQQLVSAKQTKVDDAKKAQTKLEWKTTAWKDLNTKLKNLQSKYVNNMRFTSAYMKKTTSVSDSTAASVITGENAMNGVQNLKITQLAKTAYMTGGKTSLRTKTDADGDDFKLNALTKLSDLSVDNKGTALNLSTGTTLNIKSGDTNVELEITADTTISNVLTKLKEAGLNANFDPILRPSRDSISVPRIPEKAMISALPHPMRPAITYLRAWDWTVQVPIRSMHRMRRSL